MTYVDFENNRLRRRRRDIGARVFRNTTQSIPHNTLTSLIFNSEQWDTDNCWNSGQPTRLTANTAGIYLVGAHVRFATGGTGFRSCQINHSIHGAMAYDSRTDGNLQDYNLLTSCQMAVGNFVEVAIFQFSGSAVNLQYAANHAFFFWMQLVL